MSNDSLPAAPNMLFKTVLDRMPQLVWAFDGVERAIYTNRRLRELLGVTGDETEHASISAKWIAAFHPDDREPLRSARARARLDVQPWETVRRMKPLGAKSYRWMLLRSEPVRDENGQLSFWIETATDVTEQKLKEERLASAEAEKNRLYGLLDQIPAAIGIARGPELILDFVNKAYESVGTKRELILGRPLREAHSELVAQGIIEKTRIVYNTGVPYFANDEEILVTMLDGSTVRVYMSGILLPWKNQDGEVEAVISFNYDTTASVMARKEIEKSEERLQAAKEIAENANRAKTSFFATMSHEFRTPLTAILGFNELIARPGVKSSARKLYADGIRRNGQTLLKLIEDISDLARVEAGKISVDLQTFNPRTVLEDVVSTFAEEAERKKLKIKILKPIAGKARLPTRFVSDPFRLRQILINLVGNAIKFTSEGEVAIESEFLVGKDGTYLSFSVRDSGPGLTEAQANGLFQPFAQAATTATTNLTTDSTPSSRTSKQQGSGLGLFISRSLGRLLGGDVVLTSTTAGAGSVFTARIKDLKDEKRIATSQRAARTAKTAPSLVGKKVLVVEDTKDIRDLLRANLREIGMRVDIASDGRQGSSKALAGKYDLVIMDLHMPKLDGYQATAWLRKNGFRKPILAITALAEPEDREKCFEIGFDAYLTKPVRMDNLETTLRRLLKT